jgi:hypothetical protein
MDLAGNPWGTYEQDEACIYCGSRLLQPEGCRNTFRKICSGTASMMNKVQELFCPAQPNWIHMVFRKRPFEP